MSTIASPRPSITLSSRRTSASTDTALRSPSATRPPPGHTRRNRAALREFYGLTGQETPASGTTTPALSPSLDERHTESELDKPNFDAEQYVKDVLAKEGLEGILRVEARLASEIRGFDGERKALVYDNYSKLIGATDTIRKMQTNMDPLAPTTSTLTPAISHIAETASTLSDSLKKLAPSAQSELSEAERKKEKQRQAVRWVIDAPERLRRMREEGHIESARQEWEEIKVLLERWQAVKGANEVRRECEDVMGAEAAS